MKSGSPGARRTRVARARDQRPRGDALLLRRDDRDAHRKLAAPAVHDRAAALAARGSASADTVAWPLAGTAASAARADPGVYDPMKNIF